MLRKSNSGLSLAEIVITVTLLGFIMMTLFNIFPSSMGAIRHAEHQMIASNLAQSILEEKMAGPFNELSIAPALDPVTGPDNTLYTLHDYTPFTITDTDPQYLMGIRISVSWQERNRSYTMAREIYVSSIQR